jgi:hypothetical protein
VRAVGDKQFEGVHRKRVTSELKDIGAVDLIITASELVVPAIIVDQLPPVKSLLLKSALEAPLNPI